MVHAAAAAAALAAHPLSPKATPGKTPAARPVVQRTLSRTEHPTLLSSEAGCSGEDDVASLMEVREILSVVENCYPSYSSETTTVSDSEEEEEHDEHEQHAVSQKEASDAPEALGREVSSGPLRRLVRTPIRRSGVATADCADVGVGISPGIAAWESAGDECLSLQDAVRCVVRRSRWAWWVSSSLVVGVPVASSTSRHADPGFGHGPVRAAINYVASDTDPGDACVWLLVVYSIVSSFVAGARCGRGYADAAASAERAVQRAWCTVPLLYALRAVYRYTSSADDAMAEDILRLSALGCVAWTSKAMDELPEFALYIVVIVLGAFDIVLGIGSSGTWFVAEAASRSDALAHREAVVYAAMGANFGATVAFVAWCRRQACSQRGHQRGREVALAPSSILPAAPNSPSMSEAPPCQHEREEAPGSS